MGEENKKEKGSVWEAISENVAWMVLFIVIGWIVTTCMKILPTVSK